MSYKRTPLEKTPGRSRAIGDNHKKPSLSSVRHVFKTIVWPRRGLLLIGILLIIVNRITGLVIPGSTKYLIDDVIGHKNGISLSLLLTVVGAAAFVQAATAFALTRLLSVEAQRLIAILRARIQQQIIHLPVGFFDDNSSGALVSRIMTDVEGVRNLIGTGLVQLFGGILTSAVALVLLVKINAQLTVIAVVPLLVFSVISLKAFAFIRPIFRQRSVLNAEVTGRLTESLNGIRVIKGFFAEKQEIKVFEGGVDKLFQNVKKTLTSASLVTSLATLLLGITAVTVMGVGGSSIIKGAMTTGDFVAYALYLTYLVTPIVQMSNIGTQITEAFAGLDRMEELLNLEREQDDPARAHNLEGLRGEVVFENVSFAYEAGIPVLHDVSFEAKPGTVTALVGSSGSGKTTIASLAASFLKPTSGRVLVDGQDLSKVVLGSYRSHLGVVLQDEFLFEGTIRENIRFSNPDATEAELEEAVAAAYVKEFADRFEKGLDTLIGERGVKLSGGQRQRVAIARALIADPKILVLDEATSNLDTESEAYIQKSFARLMTGRTTFVIAHRLSTIRKADQILVIEGGRIVERGDHATLIAKEGRYYDLYTYQARI